MNDAGYEEGRRTLLREVHSSVDELARVTTIKWATESLNYQWPRDADTRQALFDLEMAALTRAGGHEDGASFSEEDVFMFQHEFYEAWDGWAEDAMFHARTVERAGLPMTIESMEASYETLRRWKP